MGTGILQQQDCPTYMEFCIRTIYNHTRVAPADDFQSEPRLAVPIIRVRLQPKRLFVQGSCRHTCLARRYSHPTG